MRELRIKVTKEYAFRRLEDIKILFQGLDGFIEHLRSHGVGDDAIEHCTTLYDSLRVILDKVGYFIDKGNYSAAIELAKRFEDLLIEGIVAESNVLTILKGDKDIFPALQGRPRFKRRMREVAAKESEAVVNAMSMVHEALKAVLSEVEAYIKEHSEELGDETQTLLERVEDIRGLGAKGKGKEALERARALMAEVREISRTARAATIKARFDAAKEGVDKFTAPLEALGMYEACKRRLEQAEAAVRGGEYDRAKEHLQWIQGVLELASHHRKEMVRVECETALTSLNGSIDDLKALIRNINAKGQSVRMNFTKIEEARERAEESFRNGNYYEALTQSKRWLERIEGLRLRIYIQAIQQVLKRAREVTNQAQALGLWDREMDLKSEYFSDIERRLEMIRGGGRAGAILTEVDEVYTRALEALKESREHLSQLMETKIKRGIERLERDARNIEDYGGNAEAVHDYVDKIHDLMASGRREEALRYLDRAYKAADALKKTVAREYISGLRKRILTNSKEIKALKEVISAHAEGVKVFEEHTRGIEAFKARDYRSAAKAVEQVEVRLRLIKDEYRTLKWREFDEIRARIEEELGKINAYAQEMAWPTSPEEYRVALAEGIKAMDDGHLEDGVQAIQTLYNLMEKDKRVGLSKGCEDLISAAKNDLRILTRNGIFIDDLKEEMAAVTSWIEKGDIERAYDGAKALRAKAEERRKAQYDARITGEWHDFLTGLEALEKDGVDLKPLSPQITKGRLLEKRGRIKELEDLLHTLRGAVKELKKRHEMSVVNNDINRLRIRINNAEAEAIPLPYEEYRRFLEEAQTMAERGEFTSAKERLREKMAELEEGIRAHNRMLIVERIVPVKNGLSDLKELGLEKEVEGLEKRIDALMGRVNAGYFEGIREDIEEVSSTYVKVATEGYRSLLEPRIKALSSRLEELSKVGIDVKDLNNTLAEIKTAMESKEIGRKDYDSILGRIERIGSEAELRYEVESTRVFNALATRYHSAAEAADNVGMDSASHPSAEVMKRAVAAYDKREYGPAVKAMESAVEHLEKDLNARYLKLAGDMLGEGRKRIFEAIKIGLGGDKRKEFIKSIEAVKALMDKGRGVEAYRAAKAFLGRVEEEWMRLWSGRARTQVQHARKVVEQVMAEEGLDLSFLNVKIQNAENMIKDERYMEAYELASAIENDIAIYLNEYYKARCENLRDRINDITMEMVEYGAGVKDAIKAQSNHAYELYDKGEFKAAFHLYSNVLSALTREQKLWLKKEARRRANDVILAIKRAKEGGVDVGPMKKATEDMIAQYKAGRYRDVFTSCRDIQRDLEYAKREHSRRMAELAITVSKEIKDIRGEISTLEAQGIPTGSVEAELEAMQKALREKRYTEALEIGTKARNAVIEARNAHYRSKANEHIILAQSVLEVAQSLRVDVSEYGKKLSRAETLLKANRFSEAEGLADEVKAALEAKVKEKRAALAAKVIGEGEVSIKKAQSIGVDVTEARMELARAKAMFEDENYRQAMDVAKATLKVVDKLVKRHLKKEAERAIAEVEKEIAVEEEKGIDIKIAVTTLSGARTALNAGESEKAKAMAEKAREALVNARFEHYGKEARRLISAAMIAQATLYKYGIDISEIRSRLNRAKELMSAKEAEEALRLAKEAEELAKREMDRFLSERETINLGALQELYTQLAVKIGRKDEDRYLIDVKGAIKKARDAIKNKRYQEATELIDQGRKVLIKAEEKWKYDVLMEKLKPLEREITECERANIDVSRPKDLLEQLYSVTERYEVEEAFLVHATDGILITHVTMGEGGIDEDLVAGMLTAIQNFVKTVFAEESEEMALNTMEFGNKKIIIERGRHVYLAAVFRGAAIPLRERLRNIITQIEKNYARPLKMWSGDTASFTNIDNFLSPLLVPGTGRLGEIEDLDRYIHDIKLALKQALRDKYYDEARKVIEEAEGYVKNIGKSGADVSEAMDDVQRAWMALEYDDFDGVKALVKRAKKSAEEAEEAFRRKTAEDIIKGQEERITALKKMGARVEKLEHINEQCKTLLKKARYTDIASLNEVFEKEAEARALEAKRANARKAIDTARKTVDECHAFGADVTSAYAALDRARELVASNAFDEGEKAIEEARTLALESKRLYVRQMTQDALATMESQIVDADDFGLKTSDVRALLKRGQEELNRGNYEKAGEIARKGLKIVSDRIQSYHKKVAQETIADTERDIKGMLSMDVKGEEAMTLLAQAKEMYKAAKYQDAISLAHKANSSITKEREGVLKRTVAEYTIRLVSGMSRAKEIGVDVSKVQAYLGMIEKLYAANNLDKALDLAKKAESHLGSSVSEYKGKKSAKAIADLKSKVTIAEKEGVDLADIKPRIIKIENMHSAGEHDYVLEEVPKVIDEIEHLSHRTLMLSAGQMITDANILISELKGYGLDVRDLEEEFLKARSAFDYNDYHRSKELATEIIQRARAEKTNYLKTTVAEGYKELQRLIKDAKKLGIDTSDAQKVLHQIKMEIETGSFEKALEYIENLRKSVADSVNAYYMSAANKQIEKVRRIIAENEGLGVDVSKGNDLILQAIDLINRGEFRAAYRKAVEAEKALDEAKRAFKEKKARDTIGFIQRAIDEAERTGNMDVNTLVQFMQATQEMIQTEGVSLEDYVKKTEDIITNIRAEYLNKRINDVLNKALVRAERVEYMGGNVEDIKESVTNTRYALKFENFKEAKRLAKVTHAMARDRYVESLGEFINGLENRMLEMQEKYRIKIKKEVRDGVKKAREAYRKKDVDRAFEIVRAQNEELNAIEAHVLRDIASERFGEMTRRMDYLRKVKHNLRYAEDLLEEAKSALDDDDFGRVEAIYNKIEDLYKEAQIIEELNSIQTRVREIETDIPILKEGGMNTSPLEKIIQGLEEAIERRDLDEAKVSLLELEESFTALNNRFFAQRATSELEEVALSIRDLKRLGAGVKKAETLYERARAGAGKGNYAAVLDILTAARDEVMNARNAYYSKRVNSRILEARKALSSLASKGINTKQYTAQIKRATELAKDKRFKDALDTLEQSLEIIQKAEESYRTCTEKMGVLKSKIHAAKEMGPVYVDDALAFSKEAGTYIKAGKFGEALALLDKAIEAIDHAVEEFQKKQADERIRSLQFMISDVADRGIDVTEAENILAQAIMASSYGDYQRLHKLAEMVEDAVFRARVNAMKEHIKEDISYVEEILAQLIEAGLGKNENVRAIQKHINDAKAIYEKGDYNEALNLAVRAKQLTDTVYDKYRRIRISTYLSNLEKGLKDLRDRNLQSYVEEIEKTINRINQAKSENDIEGALALAIKGEERLKDITQSIQEGVKRLEDVKAFIRDLRNLNVSVYKAEAKVKEAEEAFNSGNIERSITLTHEAESLAREEMHSRLQQKAFDALLKAENLIKDFKKSGLEVGGAERFIEESKAAFKRKEFAKVEELVAQARELAERTRREKMLGGLERKIQALKDRLKAYEQEGVSLGAVKNDMIKLELAYRYKDTDAAENFLKEVEKGLEDAYIKHHSQIVSHYIMQGENLISRAKEFGLDTTLQSGHLEKAREALKRNEFEAATEAARRCVEEVTGIIDEYLEHRALEQIKTVKELLEDLAENGADVTGSNQKLIEAQKAFSMRDFDTAVENVEKAMELAKKTQYDFLFNRISEKISNTQNVAEELQKEGANVFEVTSLITMAQSATGLGDFAQAEAYINEAREKLRMIEGEYRKQRASDAISFTQFFIVNVRNFGGDTTSAERTLNQAKYAFEGGDFVEAERLAKEAEELAKDVKKQVMAERSRKSIDAADAVITEIEGEGVDVSEASDILRHAETALKYENFERIEELCSLAIEKAREARERFKIKRAEDTIEYAKELLADLGKEGLNVEEELKTLEKAKAALNNGRYDEATEYGKTAIVEAQEKYILFRKKKWLQLEFKRQNTLKAISNASHELELLESMMGKEMKTLRTQLQKAAFAFEEEKHEEAEKIVKMALRSIRAYRHQHLSKIAMEHMSRVQSAIDELNRVGLLTSDIEAEYSRIESAMTYRKYNEVIEAAEKLMHKVDEVRKKHVIHEVLEMMFNAEQMLMDMRAMGIELEKYENKMKTAKRAFEMEDYNKALSISREVYIKISSTMKEVSSAYDVLKSVEKEIANAKAQGIDVSEYLGRFEDARTAMNEKRFGDVKEICLELEKALVSDKMNYFQNRLRKSIEALEKERDMFVDIELPPEKIEEINGFINSARDALESGEFKEAEGYIEGGKGMIEDIKKVQLLDMVINILSQLETSIIKLDNLGIPAEDLKAHIARIKEHMSKEDYLSAYRESRAAMKIYEEDEYEKKIAKAAKRLKEMEMIKEATTYMENGEYDRAIETCDKILFVDKESVDALALKLRCLVEAGRNTEAWKFLEENREHLQDSAEGLYTMAQLLEANDRLEEAMEAYERAFDLDRELYDALYHKALCHAKLNDFDTGLRYIDEMIAGDPKNEKLLIEKAQYLYFKGLVSDAISILKGIIEIKPECEEAKALLDLYMSNVSSANGIDASDLIESRPNVSGGEEKEDSRGLKPVRKEVNTKGTDKK